MADPLVQKLLDAGFESVPGSDRGLGSSRNYKKGEVTIQFIEDFRENETTLQRCDNGAPTERTSNPKEFAAMLDKWLKPNYVPPKPRTPQPAGKKGCLAALFGIK